MQPDVKVDLNLDALDLDQSAEYTFDAKYSSSIYNGFFYRDGRQHPEFDFVLNTLSDSFNLEETLAKHLASLGDIEKAFEATARELEGEFKEYLSKNNSGLATLGWWFDDHNPSEHVSGTIQNFV